MILSRQLGIPLSELKYRLNSVEFALYYAEYVNDPYENLRDDINNAIVAATIANSLNAGKKPYKLSDFIPKFNKKVKRKTVEEMIEICRSYAMNFERR